MKTLLSSETRQKIPTKKEGAYIFMGPASIGKATLARELAEGSQIILIKPEKASIGIEAIQELSRGLSLKNQQHQTVIVDEAHTLTTEAQNAFLKTLEELPSRTLIILITHQISRLLPTVRSRCQTITLTSLSDKDIAKFIQTKYNLLAEKATEIAGFASGLPGKAVQICEEPEQLKQLKAIEARLEKIFHGSLYERMVEIPKLAEELEGDDLVALVSSFVRQKLRESEDSAHETWYDILCRIEKSLRMQVANGNKKLLNDNLILQG